MQDSAKAISPSGRRPSGNSLACHERTSERYLRESFFVNSGRVQRGRSTNLRQAANSGISAHSYTARSRNNLPKKVSKSGDESAVALLKDKEFWLYLSTWRHQDHHRFCGRAQPRRNHSDVSDFLQQCCATPNFDTKTRRSIKFAVGILISVASTLPTLRIGLRKRQSGQSTGAPEAACRLAKKILVW